MIRAGGCGLGKAASQQHYTPGRKCSLCKEFSLLKGARCSLPQRFAPRLRVLVLFVPSTIIRRYFQGGDNISPHSDLIHHPGYPPLSDSPLSRPGVEGERSKKVVGAICHGPPPPPGTVQAQPAQCSSAGPYGSTGLLLLSTGASSPPTQNSI